MRECANGLAAWLADPANRAPDGTAVPVRRVDLWTITTPAGLTFYFTNSSTRVWAYSRLDDLGHWFEPVPCKRTRLKSVTGLEVDGVEVTFYGASL